MALNGFIMFYKAKPLGSNNHTMASSKNHIKASSKNHTKASCKNYTRAISPKMVSQKITKT